jgi:type II secretion system protein N
VEPDPVQLPLQLAVDANFGQLYLREIAITNLQTTAKVDGGKINLDPCRLTLNGAPVNASGDLNLLIKGYTYSFALAMDKVPLEPIANTFSPESRGQYQGSILASAQIKGAGVTDAGLRKNLGGQASFTFTNANIQLAGPKAKKLIVPIAALLRVSEITQSPINWLDARIEVGAGNLKLSQCTIDSEAFEARTQGNIPLAEVLTNSPLNLPVEFALRRSLAEKASLLPPNTPPDARYAMLPKFITIKGTIGEPKSDLNELALAGVLFKSGVGVAEKLGANTGGKTGDALKGIGNLLTGQKPANTNASKSNAPKSNPLDPFKKK